MRFFTLLFAAVAVVAFAGASFAAIGGTSVQAVLHTVAGAEAGRVEMKQMPGGVYVHGWLGNLNPGAHGFHVHEKGLCEGPDFASAGGHYNPDGHEHGQKSPGGPHRGDLPNIQIPATGTAEIQFFAPNLSLDELMARPEGAALIIHSAADDYATQPGGNAGDRAACGVLTKLMVPAAPAAIPPAPVTSAPEAAPAIPVAPVTPEAPVPVPPATPTP